MLPVEALRPAVLRVAFPHSYDVRWCLPLLASQSKAAFSRSTKRPALP